MADRVEVARPLGPWTVEVRERTARRLADGLGLPFDPEAPVHPVLGGNLTVGLAFEALPRWILHTEGALRAVAAVYVGDSLAVAGSVRDIRRRRSRAVVTIVGDVRRDGSRVWDFEGVFSVDPDAIGVDLATLDEIDPPPEDPPGPFAPAGEVLFALPAMVAFSGPGNFHSDADVARSYGYDRPVVQGLQVAAHALDLCGYAPGDAVRYRFDAMVAEGDTVAYEIDAGRTAARGRMGSTQVFALSVARGS